MVVDCCQGQVRVVAVEYKAGVKAAMMGIVWGRLGKMISVQGLAIGMSIQDSKRSTITASQPTYPPV